MGEKISYDRQLRAIGQSLEAQRIRLFKIHCYADQFIVAGEPEKENSLLAMLRDWQKRNRRSATIDALTFTTQDIEQLDRQGRSHRSKSDRLPDFHSLANLLRTVGAHLEEKQAELIELEKKELSFSIVTRNRAGHPEFEERSLGSFYNLFIRLHENRRRQPREQR